MTLQRSLGFISLVVLNVLSEVSYLKKEIFYAKLESVVNQQCPTRDTLIVQGENAVTGTARDGYKGCLGP